MIDPKLQNKVVLITGANHGIGAAAARAFAAQGAKVCITCYRDTTPYSNEELNRAQDEGIGGELLYRAMQQQSAESLVQAIREQGGVAAALEMDLAVPANIPLLFDYCESELGAVDVLINNHTHCVLETFDPASVRAEGFSVQLLTPAGFDAHFNINTRAYTLLMLEYVQRYLKRGASWGRIINISTDAAHAHASNISYAASKHAIESYSRSAAAELGQYGITVNIIAPGPIQTGYLTPEAEAKIAAGTPLRRVGSPEDVADVMLLLASEQARWITGQLIYVGGGWRMSQ
ncbi:MAG TPA: SDR family oxidoreductase [Aggregatilineaceae bacterium]|nr:SDR family oxidoreductase [Aggregatilineaceae bacterium]